MIDPEKVKDFTESINYHAVTVPTPVQNLPNPTTSNVYWYKRSMHKYGRFPSSTR